MKNHYRIAISLFSILFLISCSQKDIKFEKPEMQILKKEKIAVQKKGALYSKQGASLFADKKDLQIGDIIQIIITEELTNSTNNKRELTNTRSASLGGGVVTPSVGNVLGGHVGDLQNKFNRNLGVGFNTESSSSFKGAVKSDADESFETKISSIIEETYQNGNYYIKGTKLLSIDGQRQELIISGVIRPYDISPDNYIESTQIANLKIMYKKDGEEQDVLEVPMILKLLLKFALF